MRGAKSFRALRLIVAAVGVIWSLAVSAAAKPSCQDPVPTGDQAESATAMVTVHRSDGSPADADMVWQPIGGSVEFIVKSSDMKVDTLRPIVCFRLHRQGFVASPRVSLIKTDAATGATYMALVPQLTAPKFFWGARAGVVARTAEIRVIVTDTAGDIVITDVVRPMGITSVWASAILAISATILAFVFMWAVAQNCNVPGAGFLKVISTKWGVASLSQLQVVLWTFVVGAGAIYVMAISGDLIDVTNGTLALLGIAGATTAASKLQSAQTKTDQNANNTASVPKAPNAVVNLVAGEMANPTEVTLAWGDPTTGGKIRSYLVQYRTAAMAGPPAVAAGPWFSVGETVTAPRYRVMDLQPGTQYDFQVIPLNEYDQGPASLIGPIATPTLPAVPAGAPGQVAGLRERAAATVGGISLIWSPVAGATRYDLQRRPHDADHDWQDCPNANAAELTITQLTDALRYDFRVAARNATGKGPWSAVLTARTVRRPRWADLVVKQDDSDEIDVTRVQMLFFTVVTAAFVGMKIVSSYTIPEIPPGFLLLTGISNGIYLTNKFITN